jgi:hypothetical protein
MCIFPKVIDCRRVLKYTYVLGFFLRDLSAEKQLFEHHQEMLEKNTERLQEYTELPLDQIDRTQVRTPRVVSDCCSAIYICLGIDPPSPLILAGVVQSLRLLLHPAFQPAGYYDCNGLRGSRSLNPLPRHHSLPYFPQVVNLTRVTEKFMSSLLASMTGGVVTLDSDLSTAASSSASASANPTTSGSLAAPSSARVAEGK